MASDFTKRILYLFINKNKFFILFFLFLFNVVFAQGNYNDSLSVNTQKEIDLHISSDSILMDFLYKSDIEITNNNKLKIFNSGDEKFKDLFPQIKKATNHVHLEYFNFCNDSIGNALFDLLAEKVQEGVKVRVICDAFGNSSNKNPFSNKKIKEIRSKGIEFFLFAPARFPYVTYPFHRDHRKNVVIDGNVGYLGGMNVADYYIKGKLKIGNWYDTHVRIEGSAVKHLQKIFLETWNKLSKQNIEGGNYFPDLDTILGNKKIAIVDRASKKYPEQMRRTYDMAISSAQKSIKIVNPYFLPPKIIKQELKDALKRGVELEIMFSKTSDIPFTPDGAIDVAYRLVKKGAKVYLYDKGFHHSKIMMVDGKYCTIGSTNLESRSLRYDYEVNAFIFDEEDTKELIDKFEEDKKNSVQLTKEYRKKHISCWKRFLGKMANMLTPFL